MSKQKPRTWKAWAIVNGDDLMPRMGYRLEVYKTRDAAKHSRALRTDRVIRVTITENEQ